jgi:salicylate hydroxylase
MRSEGEGRLIGRKETVDLKPILIAGGGVGGLCAALGLARVGRASLVLERAPAFREVGAGLQLASNATRILRDYEVLDSLNGLAVAPEFIRVRRGRDGADLARLPVRDAQRRWGAPYLNVHRADLLSALVERARGNPLIEIRNDAMLTGFVQDEQGVAVTYRAKEETHRASGAALIGADGVRSLVRARLHDKIDDAAQYTGHTAWRAVVPASDLPAPLRDHASNIWLGDKAHVVHYPLRGGAVVNIVALVEDNWRGEVPDATFWDSAGDRRFLLDRFKDWAPEARTLLSASQSWLRWPLFDRTPVPDWSRGRVGLLGDAAHPMLPYLAQGAAQAIEDSAALALAFLEHGRDPGKALTEYSRARIERAGKIQAASRSQGKIYHLAGPPAFARDLVLRLTPPGRLMARQNWIYSA